MFRRYNTTAGHSFEHDPVKLERLRDLTAELRLGVKPSAHAEGTHYDHEQQRD